MRLLSFLILSSVLLVCITSPRVIFAQGAGSASAVEGQFTGSESGGTVQQNESTTFSGLSDLYTLGLSLVGISALFMIIWGGTEYVIAGDNETRVSSGKKKIWAALTGIVVAAGSYLLLYTINPNLVKLRIGTVQEYQKIFKPTP